MKTYHLLRRNSLFIIIMILAAVVWALLPVGNAEAQCSNGVTVTSPADSGAGTLRQAITDICPGGTINFNLSTYPATITAATALDINKSLTITGPGADKLTISGGGKVEVFNIYASTTVNISGLTISGAFGDFGGGIENDGTLTVTNSTFSGNSAPLGGGILNGGTLTVTNSTFSGNSADIGSGIDNEGTLTVTNSTFSRNSALAGGGYGAIFNGGTSTVTNSTFSGNSAFVGGGIENDGTLTVTNSTFSGNSALAGGDLGGYGGGILNGGTLTVTNSTFSGNGADVSGGGIYEAGGTGVSASASLRNTIVANSTSGGNCGGTITSLGHNLEYGDKTDTCGFTSTGDIIGQDPKLGPLALNAPGTTETFALLAGSPAIDAADPNHFPLTDQRGVIRPQGAKPDIGAYEYVAGGQVLSLSLALNQTAYTVGDPLNVDLTLVNPGGQLLADVYFAILLPASSGPSLGCPLRDALLFFTNGLTSASVACASDPIQSFPRAFKGVTIPGGLPSTTLKNFLSIIWPQGAPSGEYTVFMLLTPPNALMDGTVNPGDIIGLATATMSFSP